MEVPRDLRTTRGFSRRVRTRVLAHHHCTLEGDGSATCFENNERLLKARVSHRDASTFDGKCAVQALCLSQGLAVISNQGLVVVV